jgi:ADP-L-glycero-D-manno-heptose 6-epimerase
VARRPARSSCSATTAATAGEQRRDFVAVDDVVAVNLWFLEHPRSSGIFNLGTGRAQPFNDVARATVVNACRAQRGRRRAAARGTGQAGIIEYIDFPTALVGKYQCFTQADLSALRAAGCEHEFADVATGVCSAMSSGCWAKGRGAR